MAESIYGRDGAKETQESTVGKRLIGQIAVDGDALTGKISKTLQRMAKERRAMDWMERELVNHASAHATKTPKEMANCTDMQLLREHITALAKHGKVTKYIKIVHSAVATNNVLTSRDQTESGLCPCCQNVPETLHHILAECTCKEIAEMREQMITNIRDAITENLTKTTVDRALMRAICSIWSSKTIKHAVGRDQTKAAGQRPSKSNMDAVRQV